MSLLVSCVTEAASLRGSGADPDRPSPGGCELSGVAAGGPVGAQGTGRVLAGPGDGTRLAHVVVPGGVRVLDLGLCDPPGRGAAVPSGRRHASGRDRRDLRAVGAPSHGWSSGGAGRAAGRGRRSGVDSAALAEQGAEASPAAVKAELEKLAFLRGLDAHTMDLSMLPAERRRFLAGLGRRLTPQALARREPQRRYPILVTVLAQAPVEVLDEVIQLFDQAVSSREGRARRRMSEHLAERVLLALRDGLRCGDVFAIANKSSRSCWRPSPVFARARVASLCRSGQLPDDPAAVGAGPGRVLPLRDDVRPAAQRPPVDRPGVPGRRAARPPLTSEPVAASTTTD